MGPSSLCAGKISYQLEFKNAKWKNEVSLALKLENVKAIMW